MLRRWWLAGLTGPILMAAPAHAGTLVGVYKEFHTSVVSCAGAQGALAEGGNAQTGCGASAPLGGANANSSATSDGHMGISLSTDDGIPETATAGLTPATGTAWYASSLTYAYADLAIPAPSSSIQVTVEYALSRPQVNAFDAQYAAGQHDPTGNLAGPTQTGDVLGHVILTDAAGAVPACSDGSTLYGWQQIEIDLWTQPGTYDVRSTLHCGGAGATIAAGTWRLGMQLSAWTRSTGLGQISLSWTGGPIEFILQSS